MSWCETEAKLELRSYPQKYRRWWLQIFYISISISICGRFPLLTHFDLIFQVGWFNHQLEFPAKSWLCVKGDFIFSTMGKSTWNDHLKKHLKQKSKWAMNKNPGCLGCIGFIVHSSHSVGSLYNGLRGFGITGQFKKKFRLYYRGWNPTQFFGDLKNSQYKDPYKPTSIMESRRTVFFRTVDGRNPAPPGMVKTL